MPSNHNRDYNHSIYNHSNRNDGHSYDSNCNNNNSNNDNHHSHHNYSNDSNSIHNHHHYWQIDPGEKGETVTKLQLQVHPPQVSQQCLRPRMQQLRLSLRSRRMQPGNVCFSVARKDVEYGGKPKCRTWLV